MPQADGTILIDTEINADGMKAGSKEVEAAVRRMAASVDDMGTKARTALNKQVDAFAKMNNEYAAQAKKVDDLKRKVSEYASQKIPTREYAEIQKQITDAEQKMNRLIAAQEKFAATGGSKNSKTYKRYQYEIEELANTIKYATAELKELEASGKAFTMGNKTKQAAADMEKLAAAERKLADLNNKLGTSYSSIKGRVNDYKNNLINAGQAQNKVAAAGNNVSNALKATGKSANSASFGIGKMLGTSILFSFAFQAINAALTGIKDGFGNLAQYSATTNNSISMLWGSLERLKNSLATAFAPILNVVAPILSKFIDMLSTAASYVSMFFAFLSGKSTYTRAIAVQKDYAASLNDTKKSSKGASGAAKDNAKSTKDAADATKEAKEEAEGYLSPLDEINKYEKEKNKNTPSGSTGSGGSPSGGSGGGGGSGSGPMFEEVPIDNKFASLMDSILDKLKQIRDIFMDGFWDGLGDYKPLLKELKKDLASIGKSLTEIFTDADVKKAAKRFAKSFIYNLGKIVGSFARVGLAIAVNIVGGIESYLRQNVNRIKKYLISMFNVGADIMDLLGDLAAGIAEIFSDVFSSQTAQDLTGDIIGIFIQAFMTITELAAKFGRDTLNVIVQPILDNKEKIKKALMETVEPIESVAQTIETFLNNVSDSLMEFYDTYMRPFLQSLADGISSIFGTLLEVYNSYVAPVLDQLAQKFEEIMSGPAAEMIDTILSTLGKALTLLQMLWENVLQPLFNWLIENVFPILSQNFLILGGIILDLLETAILVVTGIFTALGGLLDFLLGVFTGNWSLAFSGFKDILLGFRNAAKAVFDFVQKNILQPFDEFLNGIFSIDFVAAFGVFGHVLQAFVKSFQGIYNSIKKILNGLIQFLDGVFTLNWKKAWTGIKNIFKGIWDLMVSVVKTPINLIIGAINTLIDGCVRGINAVIGALNKLSFTIPDWVPKYGGNKFGINIGTISAPRIPYLASGAIIPPNREFLAVLGDQKRGTNIETPESLLRKIMREELAKQKSSGGSYSFTAQINRRTLFEEFIKEAQMQQMRTGKNPFESFM